MEPESLCTRVLKAKYYPDGDLLKSEEKPGISYSRRSIVRGLKAIKQGMIRRVGDGTMINIWGDPGCQEGLHGDHAHRGEPRSSPRCLI
jgi:hypothetical protein